MQQQEEREEEKRKESHVVALVNHFLFHISNPP